MDEKSHIGASLFRQAHLQQIASLIKVADIYTPFIGVFNESSSLEDVWEEWLEASDGNDPMDGLGGIADSRGKLIGLVDFEDLKVGEALADRITPIPADKIVSDATPLLAAATLFADQPDHYFVVIRGNSYVGWLRYSDLLKLPFRLCLFAELLDIESKLRCVISTNPSFYLGMLSEGEKKHARGLYRNKKFKYDDDGGEYPHKLAECTSFTARINMVARGDQGSRVPALLELDCVADVIKCRNGLAHPDSELENGELISREKLKPFLEWLEALTSQLTACIQALDAAQGS